MRKDLQHMNDIQGKGGLCRFISVIMAVVMFFTGCNLTALAESPATPTDLGEIKPAAIQTVDAEKPKAADAEASGASRDADLTEAGQTAPDAAGDSEQGNPGTGNAEQHPAGDEGGQPDGSSSAHSEQQNEQAADADDQGTKDAAGETLPATQETQDASGETDLKTGSQDTSGETPSNTQGAQGGAAETIPATQETQGAVGEKASGATETQDAGKTPDVTAENPDNPEPEETTETTDETETEIPKIPVDLTAAIGDEIIDSLLNPGETYKVRLAFEGTKAILLRADAEFAFTLRVTDEVSGQSYLYHGKDTNPDTGRYETGDIRYFKGGNDHLLEIAATDGKSTGAFHVSILKPEKKDDCENAEPEKETAVDGLTDHDAANDATEENKPGTEPTAVNGEERQAEAQEAADSDQQDGKQTEVQEAGAPDQPDEKQTKVVSARALLSLGAGNNSSEYEIITVNSRYGNLFSNKTKATQGENIEVRVKPTEGYKLEALKIQLLNDPDDSTPAGTIYIRQFTNNIARFSMPNKHLKISAQYTEGKTCTAHATWDDSAADGLAIEHAMILTGLQAYDASKEAWAEKDDSDFWLDTKNNGSTTYRSDPENPARVRVFERDDEGNVISPEVNSTAIFFVTIDGKTYRATYDVSYEVNQETNHTEITNTLRTDEQSLQIEFIDGMEERPGKIKAVLQFKNAEGKWVSIRQQEASSENNWTVTFSDAPRLTDMDSGDVFRIRLVNNLEDLVYDHIGIPDEDDPDPDDNDREAYFSGVMEGDETGTAEFELIYKYVDYTDENDTAFNINKPIRVMASIKGGVGLKTGKKGKKVKLGDQNVTLVFPVDKVWDDDFPYNKDIGRFPASTKIQLQHRTANNQPWTAEQTYTLTEADQTNDNTWHHEFQITVAQYVGHYRVRELDANDVTVENGADITFDVNVNGKIKQKTYTAGYNLYFDGDDDMGRTLISNVYDRDEIEPYKAKIEFTDDFAHQYSPYSITVQLQKKVGNAWVNVNGAWLTLKEDENWEGSFHNNDGAEEGEYRVREVDDNNHIVLSSDDANEQNTVRSATYEYLKDRHVTYASVVYNYHQDSKLTTITNGNATVDRIFEVKIDWTGDENQNISDRDNVQVKLQKKVNGNWTDVQGQEKTLSKQNNWKTELSASSTKDDEFRIREYESGGQKRLIENNDDTATMAVTRNGEAKERRYKVSYGNGANGLTTITNTYDDVRERRYDVRILFDEVVEAAKQPVQIKVRLQRKKKQGNNNRWETIEEKNLKAAGNWAGRFDTLINDTDDYDYRVREVDQNNMTVVLNTDDDVNDQDTKSYAFLEDANHRDFTYDQVQYAFDDATCLTTITNGDLMMERTYNVNIVWNDGQKQIDEKADVYFVVQQQGADGSWSDISFEQRVEDPWQIQVTRVTKKTGVRIREKRFMNEQLFEEDTLNRLRIMNDGYWKEVYYRVNYQYDENSKTFTITHTYANNDLEFTVKAIWQDENNADKLRKQLYIRLLANGEGSGHGIWLKENNDWTGKFTDVPERDGNDQLIDYTLEVSGEIDTGLDGEGTYSVEYGQDPQQQNVRTITLKHTPKTKISGHIEWRETGTATANDRPGSVTVQLRVGNNVRQEKRVTSPWEFTFENLDKYENGAIINYDVSERNVEGYEIAKAGTTLINSRHKDRDDDDDQQQGQQGGQNPPGGGGGGAPWTLSPLWKKIIIGVGAAIGAGIIGSIIGNSGGSGDDDKPSTETKTVSGKITWKGIQSNEAYPDFVIIHLLADGVPLEGEKHSTYINKYTEDNKIRSANDWTFQFSGVYKYNQKTGKEIKYTVCQDPLDDFETVVSGMNITNTYDPGYTSVPVGVVWDDGENNDGIRPDSVTVTVNGQKEVLNASNNWNTVFNGVKKGSNLTPQVVKTSVLTGTDGPGTYGIKWVSQQDGSANDEHRTGEFFKLTHTPETLALSGRVQWDDANDRDGLRPQQVSLQLMCRVAGNEKDINTGDTYRTIATAENDWQWNFNSSERVEKYYKGQVIEYFIAGEEIPEYTAEVDGLRITYIHTRDSFRITFDANGGHFGNEDGSTQEVIEKNLKPGEATEPSMPEDPVREGYRFTGWEPEIPAEMPEEDLSVSAKWEEIGQSETPDTIDAEATETTLTVTVPANDPDAEPVYEYSRNGTEWQESPLFDGLTPDTEYTLYARVRATETNYASEPVSGVFATLNIPLESVGIQGKGAVGETLRAAIAPEDAPNVTYQWFRGEEPVENETGTEYATIDMDAGYEIHVTATQITRSGEKTEKESDALLILGPGPEAPLSIDATAAETSLTVVRPPMDEEDRLTYEYSRDGETWQDETLFDGLTPNTEYTLYARVKADGRQAAGEAVSGTFRTLPTIARVFTARQKADGSWPQAEELTAEEEPAETSYTVPEDAGNFTAAAYSFDTYTANEEEREATCSGTLIQLPAGTKTLYIYYNRRSYTLNFYRDAAGTEIEKSEAVLFEAPIGALAPELTAEGYTIAGWSLTPLEDGEYTDETANANKADLSLITMPAETLNLYPIPVRDLVEIRLDTGAFDANANAENLNGWTPQAYADETTKAWLDASQPRRFTVPAGSFPDTEAMKAATRDGYILDGWYTEGNVQWEPNPARKMAADPQFCDKDEEGKPAREQQGNHSVYTLTLTARWTLREAKITYQYGSASLPEGAELPDQTVKAGETARITDVTPRPNEAFAFIGWKSEKNGQLYTAGSSFAYLDLSAVTAIGGHDTNEPNLIPLTAVYEEIPAGSGMVIPDTRGGNAINPITVTIPGGVSVEEKLIEELKIPDPTRKGYAFAGWTDAYGKPVTVVGIPMNGSVLLYAKWTPLKFRITYVTNGGPAIDPNPAEIDCGAEIIPPAGYISAAEAMAGGTAPTTREYGHFRFEKWSPELPETMPAEDLTVEAVWTATYYDIEYVYDFEGIEQRLEGISAPYGTVIGIPANPPAPQGFVFGYWTLDGEKADPPTLMPDENRTYRAFWLVKPAARPDAPEIMAVTDTTVRVVRIDGQEYSIDDGKTWQTGDTFTGLTPNTLYDRIVTRIAATDTQAASDISPRASARTRKADQEAPNPPSGTAGLNTIEVIPVIEGQQYSLDGGETWKDPDPDNSGRVIFYGLQPGTPYNLTARWAETERQNASPASEPTVLTTLKTQIYFVFEDAEGRLPDTIPTVAADEAAGTYTVPAAPEAETLPEGTEAAGFRVSSYLYYYSTEGNGTTVREGENIRLNPNMSRLYLYYSRNSFTLNFYRDAAGTEIEKTVSVLYGAPIAAHAPTMTAEGYTFAGWSVSKPEKGAYTPETADANKADLDNITMPAKTLGLYPIFVRDQVEIHLDPAADVVWAKNDQPHVFMVSVGDVPDPEAMKATRNGYLPEGWYTAGNVRWTAQMKADPVYCDPGTDGKPVKAQLENYALYTMTLTARWKLRDARIVYDYGTASLPEGETLEPQKVKPGQTATITEVLPGPSEGVAFNGWEDGNGRRYSPGSSLTYDDLSAVTIPGDHATTEDNIIELKAVYVEIPDGTGLVVFDTQGGNTIEPAVIQVSGSIGTTESLAELTGENPTRDGYRFDYWMDAPDGEEIEYVEVHHDETVTVYAHWTPEQFKISYVTGDGPAVNDTYYDCGAEVDQFPKDSDGHLYEPGVTATADGHYTFVKWSPQLPKTMPAHDVTAEAMWQAKQYTISFEADGKAYGRVTGVYGSAVTAPKDPEKEGHVFAGWRLKDEESTSEVPAVMPDTNPTYIAVFLAIPGKPEKPQAEATSPSTVRVTTVPGQEYTIDDGESWQTAEETALDYEGLTPNTRYEIRTRIPAKAPVPASEPSDPAAVTTPKAEQEPPAAPNGIPGQNTIEVNPAFTGQEYSRDNGKTWVQPKDGKVIFSGLKPGTDYEIVTRLKETETQNASPASQPAKVTTLKTQIYFVYQDAKGNWPETAPTRAADEAASLYTVTPEDTGKGLTGGEAASEFVLIAYSFRYTAEAQSAERKAATTNEAISLVADGEDQGTLYVYFTRKQHRVLFYGNMEGTGKPIQAGVYYYGESLSGLALPEEEQIAREGYTFQKTWWTTAPKGDGEYSHKAVIKGEKQYCLAEDIPGMTMPEHDLSFYPVLIKHRVAVHLDTGAADAYASVTNMNGWTNPKAEGYDTLTPAYLEAKQYRSFMTNSGEKLIMDEMNRITRDGYLPEGWYTPQGVQWTDEMGTSPQFCDSTDTETAANGTYSYYTITLTAKWKARNGKIVYNYGAASLPEGEDLPEQAVAPGETVTISSVQPRPNEAFTFIGWEDRNGKRYSAGSDFTYGDLSTVTVFGNHATTDANIIELKAVFEEIPAGAGLLVFDTRGGKTIDPMPVWVEGSLPTELSHKEIEEMSGIPEREGYDFDYWTDAPEGEKAETIAIERQQTVTVYAHWTPREYTITYDTNGGPEISPNPVTVRCGEEITAPKSYVTGENATTKEYGHFLFNGWDPELPETMPAKDLTVRAVWKARMYKVQYLAGDYSLEISAPYGTNIPLPATPQGTGNLVFGYWTLDGEEAEPVSVMPDLDLVFEACWLEKQEAPDAPEIRNVTATTIQVKAKDGQEYSIDDGETWQRGDTFTGLTPHTTYEIVTRYAATETKKESEASRPTAQMTLKENREAPNPPTGTAGLNTIEVDPVVAGQEYSLDGGETWNLPDGNGKIIYENLAPGTPYNLTARWAETERQYASPASEPTTLTTLKTKIYFVFEDADGLWPANAPAKAAGEAVGSYTVPETPDRSLLPEGTEAAGFSAGNYSYTYNPEGKGTTIHAGANIPVKADKGSLYIYYERNRYDVTFYGDIAGAEEPILTVEGIPYGASLAGLTPPTAEKEGYTFRDGWWTLQPKTDGEYDHQEIGSEILADLTAMTMPAAPVSLYPILIRDRVEVRLETGATDANANAANLNGWTNPPQYTDDGNPAYLDAYQYRRFTVSIGKQLGMNGEENSTTPAGTAKAGMNQITRDGYVPDGWYNRKNVRWTAAMGLEPEYCDGTEKTQADTYAYYTLTLTARWKLRNAEIVYNYGTANLPDDEELPSQTVLPGETVTISPVQPRPNEAYAFIGWEARNGKRYSAGSEFTYDDLSAVTTAGNHTTTTDNIIELKAVFAEIPAGAGLLVFDTRGGDAIEPIPVWVEGSIPTELSHEEIEDMSGIPEREGYIFDYWMAAPEGQKINTITVDRKETVTVYAHWTPRKYTITYKTGDGPAIAEQSYDCGADVDQEPKDVNDRAYKLGVTTTGDGHYTFEKWTPALPKTMPAYHVTVEAIWQPTVYTVTFEADGEEYARLEGYFGSALTIPEDPEKKNHLFTGWRLKDEEAVSDVPQYMPDTRPTYIAVFLEMPGKPAKPEIDQVTATSLRVKTKAGQEYSIDGGNTWQTASIITGLTPATDYEVITRIAARDPMPASEASDPTEATTLKEEQAAPNPPNCIPGLNTIEVKPAVSGQEYSMDGGATWVKPKDDSSLRFTGLKPGTKYSIITRMAETRTQYASPASEPTEVTTLKTQIYFVYQDSKGKWPEKAPNQAINEAVNAYTVSAADTEKGLGGSAPITEFSLDAYSYNYTADAQSAERKAATMNAAILLVSGGEDQGTLYVYFTRKQHNVNFYGNMAGTGAPILRATYYYGEALSDLRLPEVAQIAREGYSFRETWWTEKPKAEGEYSYKAVIKGTGQYCLTENIRETVMGAEDLNFYPVLIRNRLAVHLDTGAADRYASLTNMNGWTNPNADGYDPDTPAYLDENQYRSFMTDRDEKLIMNEMNRITRDGYLPEGWYTAKGVRWDSGMGTSPEYCDSAETKTAENGGYDYYTITLTAKWKARNGKIVYNYGAASLPEGEDLPDQAVAPGETVAISSVQPRPNEAFTFIGWEDKNGKRYSAGSDFTYDDLSAVTGIGNHETTEDNIIELKAVFEEIPAGAGLLVFDTQGGNTIDPMPIWVEGSLPTELSQNDLNEMSGIPEREGYDFDYWTDAPEGEKAETIAIKRQQTVTVYAHWTPREYTITYDTNGGPAIAEQTYDCGADVNPNPTGADGKAYTPGKTTRENGHYTFVKWSPELPGKMPASNLTVDAIWQPVKFTITFMTENEEYNVLEDYYGQPVTAPKEPEREGELFSGWRLENESAVSDLPQYMPDTNPTYIAVFGPNPYTPGEILMSLDRGTGAPEFKLDRLEDEAILAIAEAAVPGARARRLRGEAIDLRIRIDRIDRTVTAEEKQAVQKALADKASDAKDALYLDITVSLLIGDRTAAKITDLGTHPVTLTMTVPEALKATDKNVRRTYHIVRVHDGKGEILASGNSLSIPFSSALYSTYGVGVSDETMHSIKFDTDGGSEIENITQFAGTDVTKPANPAKEGYTFDGWDPEIPEKMPEEDLTVKAKWKINQYTITFDTDGGSKVSPIKQDYGTAVTRPKDPTRTGYTFMGWDQPIPQKMPAGNLTIKATWKINAYTIVFDSDGGNAISPITQNYGTKVKKPADPKKKNYTFTGWSPEIPDTMPAKDLTVKAKWKKNDDGKSVNTGDDSNMPLWITMLALLILGMVGFNVFRFRGRRREKTVKR